MKILLVGNPSIFTNQVYNALVSEGQDCVWLHDREAHFLPFGGSHAMSWRLAKNIPILRRINKYLFNKKLLTMALRTKPDILLVLKGTMIRRETLATLRRAGIRSANWFPENVRHREYQAWFLANHSAYDFFLTFDSSVAGTYYVPFAVDPMVWQAHPDESRTLYACDLLFVGAPYPERVRALEAIRDAGVNMKIFGWKGWSNTSLAPHYFGPLDARRSAVAYRAARICLNMNLEPEISGVNLKTFEIPASGGFQLSDYRNDVEKLFQTDKEIALFRGHEELLEKIRYYLNHESERSAIAAAGHARVLRDHTMKQRIKEILTLLA